MEKLNELVELAKEISSKQWFMNPAEEVTAIDNDAGPDDSEEVFIGCAANIQLAKYIAAASPENILAIAEAFRALEKEARKNLEGAFAWQNRAEAAEAKLAELEKQEPVGYVSDNSAQIAESGRLGYISNHQVAGLAGRYVYARPTPAADLAELVPDGWKLVPGEPTKEMVAAGQDKFEECIDSGFDSCEDGSTYEYSKISSDAPYLVYIAMLAAAPEVE